MAELFSEKVAVLGTIDPDAYGPDLYGAVAYATDWIDMKVFDQVGFVVMAGAFGAGATLDFKVQEATSDAGAGAQDLSGKSITQLTDAGNDDDKQVIVNVKAPELSVNDGYRYVRGVMTCAVDDIDEAVIALGVDPSYKPASNFDLASVDEIVS